MFDAYIRQLRLFTGEVCVKLSGSQVMMKSGEGDYRCQSIETANPAQTILSFHLSSGELTAVHIWPQVTPTTPMTSATSARNSNEPSGRDGLHNTPRDILRHCSSHLEPKQHVG